MEQQISNPCNYWKTQKNTVGWCHTTVQVVNFSYTWTISNFSMLTEKIESSIFSTGHNDELEWRLTVDPCYTCDAHDYLSVFLKLVSSTRDEVQANFTFSIINAYSQKAWVAQPSKPDKFVKDKDRGYVKFCLTSYLFKKATILLPNDKLTISVEVNVITDIVNITKGKRALHIKAPDYQLRNELQRLLKTEQLCDVVFNVSGRDVLAHKAILAARSPVFLAMFQQNMTEQLTGRVEVNDIELKVFSEMLQYIYTDEVPHLQSLAEGLLEAAEKYDLRRLKALAETALCKTLGIENAAKRLMFADVYNANRLKSVAIEFINMHTKDVVKTAGFEQIVTCYPLLLADILLATITEKKIVDEDKNKRRIVDIMLLLPGDFLETKIVISICWVGSCIFQRFRD